MFVRMLGVCAVMCGAVSIGFAQTDYPVRPVRFVVPFPPGGGTDLIARMVAEKLANVMGQPLVVDNRPGAAGTVGANVVARASADGYTLLLATGTFTIAAGASRNLPYDPRGDFAAVGLLASQPLVLVTHPGLPARSVTELVTLARAKPGMLNYASGGTGGINHLAAELFARTMSIELTHIPYKGAGPAIGALLSGETQLMIATLGSCLNHIQAGKLKAIALARGKRVAQLPDLPTMQEGGVSGYAVDNWYGVLAPRGVASTIIGRINRDLATALSSDELKRRLNAQAFEPETSTPAQFAAHVRAEIEKWTRISAAAGIVLQ